MCHCSALQFPSSQEVWKAAQGPRAGRCAGEGSGPGLQGAPLTAPLSSPTSLPAIFPLWPPFLSCNKSLLSRALSGMACVDSVPALKVLLGDQWLTLSFLKSHSGGGQSTKWDHVSLKTLFRSPKGISLPSGLPETSESFRFKVAP